MQHQLFNTQSILPSQRQEATKYDVNHVHFNQFQTNELSIQDSVIHEAWELTTAQSQLVTSIHSVIYSDWTVMYSKVTISLYFALIRW